MKAIPAALLLAAASLVTTAHAQGYNARADASSRVTGSQADNYPQLGDWPVTVYDGHYVGSQAFNHSAQVINFGGMLNGKSTTAFSYADLRTGKLGTFAAVSNDVSAPSSVTSVMAIGSAEFGDSYRFVGADGMPYDWAAAAPVSFDFHIDGALTNTSGDARALIVQFQLEIYKPGSIGNTFSSSTRLGEVFWYTTVSGAGTVSLVADRQDPANPLQFDAGQTGSFASGGYDLHARFLATGDFDWRVSMLSAASLSTGTGMAIADLSHTATGAFTGPANAVIQAASGHALPALAPVPEPATWALALAGSLVVGFMSRRRRVKR